MDESSFSAIDWSAGPYFIEVYVNGSSMGTSELLSVPYALYAASGNPGPQGPQGDPGPKGDKGDTGTAGGQGDQEYAHPTTAGRAMATLHLPNGVKVTEVRVYSVDCAANYLTVYFRRSNATEPYFTYMHFRSNK